MTDTADIGLPRLSEEDIERLAEECEAEVTRYITRIIPPKSISDMIVVCSLELNEGLHLSIDVDLNQKYDTGVSLDDVVEQAVAHGAAWLEKVLREMKVNEH
ncbi:MAG: DUF3194 domain-containing protein [Candidatus Thorarchaeota archaeon]